MRLTCTDEVFDRRNVRTGSAPPYTDLRSPVVAGQSLVVGAVRKIRAIGEWRHLTEKQIVPGLRATLTWDFLDMMESVARIVAA